MTVVARRAVSPPRLCADQLAGVLRIDEPMSRHTSWRVGGPADWHYVPAGREDLARFVGQLPPDVEVVWVGLGSNLLVRDGGVRGAVIATHKGLDGIWLTGENMLAAEAGVAAAKIARFALRAGLVGAEFLAGIPGTLGGALAMNAGAFGSETWNIVRSVETLDRAGRIRRRLPSEFETGYRTVGLPEGERFVAAELALTGGDVEAGRARVRELLRTRALSQPVQTANAGSVFRNPPGDFAARLIESADLKGATEGGACVSQRHANFIVNGGGATAADIERLIERVHRIVKEMHSVDLELEVRIVGEPA